MPGTTYTRKGPEQDAIGRLADFSRFSVEETGAILAGMLTQEENQHTMRAMERAARIRRESLALAEMLNGYTTAED